MTIRETRTLFGILCAVLLSAGSALAASSKGGEWTGTIAAVSGDDLALVGVADHFRLAGSVTELMSGRTLSATDLAPGSSVTLRVGDREADGRFRADRVVLQAKNPLSVRGEINRIADDRRHVEVHGVEIEIDDHTAFSGRGGAGTIRSARDLKVGAVVDASLITASGTLRAASIRASSEPDDEGDDQEVKGTVTAISDTSWTIDATAFAVTDATVFEGDPGIGDFVEVKFHLADDGSRVADRIEKEDAQGAEVEFTGIVEAISDASWTISGQVVAIDSATEIVGSPQMGDTVEVKAEKSADGHLTARRIKKEDAQQQEVEFQGAVEAMAPGAWTISGKSVLVTSATEIDGNPAVGDTVEVHATKAADGTLTATRIQKEDSAGGNDGGNDDGNDDHGGTAPPDDNGNSGSNHGGSNNGGDDDPSGHD